MTFNGYIEPRKRMKSRKEISSEYHELKNDFENYKLHGNREDKSYILGYLHALEYVLKIPEEKRVKA